MERSFAASAARLRQNSRWIGRQASGSILLGKRRHGSEKAELTSSLGAVRLIPSDSLLLDRVVPILLVAFLALAGLSMLVHMTLSRSQALLEGEAALMVAANLAETRIRSSIDAGEPPARGLQMLPTDAHQPGRAFLIADPTGAIRFGIGAGAVAGRPAATLFADGLAISGDATTPWRGRGLLRSGDEASIIRIALPAGHGSLIAYQPVDDEISGWRRQALAIGGLMLSFGAVTIAFALAYAAQRDRARFAGATATHLYSRFETALARGRCGLWDHVNGSDTMLWSSSMWQLLGQANDNGTITRAELVALLHPDDPCPLASIKEAQQAQGRDIDHLFRMRHAAGHFVWLRLRAVQIDPRDGGPMHLVGFVMDVTQERRLDEDNHRADLRLRDAIESISEAFVLWDENNNLVMCNSKYQTFHGLPVELAQRGVAYRVLMAKAAAPQVRGEHAAQGAEPGDARTYEAELADGRWLQISERQTSQGGFVSVGTDITAHKLQEQRLLENERQLRGVIHDLGESREKLRRQTMQLSELAERYFEQKAEAIGAARVKAAFLANMNHEMRTPLNAIIGFAEAIEGQMWGPLGSERYQGYAQDIRQSGERLLCLINDVLDMAHIEAGRVALEREATEVGALLQNAVLAVSRDAIGKNVSIEVDPALDTIAGRQTIMADARAITQALAHLLRNAVRLSPPGGQVFLRARMQGSFLNVFVSDMGCTLSAQDLGAMQNPFGHIDGMLHNGCKGSGLGFPIARSLIELHGGSLRVRSSPQIGSMVMVHLPVAAEPVQLNLPMVALEQRRSA